jgi:hypothetical protein
MSQWWIHWKFFVLSQGFGGDVNFEQSMFWLLHTPPARYRGPRYP